MAVISDLGFHCTSYGYGNVADCINADHMDGSTPLSSTLMTYSYFLEMARCNPDLDVSQVLRAIGEISGCVSQKTAPLYIAQWLLHRVDTDSHHNDSLLRQWMNSRSILELMNYSETGDIDDAPTGLDMQRANELISIPIPCDNFIEQMHKSLSFDIHASLKSGGVNLLQ